MRNRIVRLLSLTVLGLSLTGAAHAADSAKKNIVIGTTVGDFADMVRESVKPALEKDGYQVRLIEFTDYVQPNLALAQKALDVNVFQHKPYLDEFAKNNKLALSPVFEVPTAPLGLYAGKTKSLKAVRAGDAIAVPNDPSNYARALVMLADLGWLKLKPKINPLTASARDIAANPMNLKILQLEAAQLPRSRNDANFAIINGNFATSSGLKLTDALAREQSYAFVNWGVVRTEDVGKPWVKDVIAAYNSAQFKAWAKKKYPGYKFPSTWH